MKLAHTTHTRTHAHTHTHTHAAAHHFWLFLLALHRAEKKPPSLGAPSTVTCFQAAVSWLACFLPKNSPSKSRSASAPTFACIMCGECMMSPPPLSLSFLSLLAGVEVEAALVEAELRALPLAGPWAFFMLAGGHFAGAIANKGQSTLLYHCCTIHTQRSCEPHKQTQPHVSSLLTCLPSAVQHPPTC